MQSAGKVTSFDRKVKTRHTVKRMSNVCHGLDLFVLSF